MKHFRFLHYLLKDKNNYERDKELSYSWDIYLYYLDKVKDMSWFLIKMKFLYFIKYKKIYLLKLSSFFSISILILFFLGKYILENNPFIEPKRIIYYNNIDTIYCPDTIPVDNYINRLSKISNTSYKIIKNRIFVVTVYTQDTLKTGEKWLRALAELESRGKLKAENGQFWGAWQMGNTARTVAGFGGVSKQEFMNSTEIQKSAVIAYLKKNYEILSPYLNKYDNKIIRGYHLTRSGLLAMSHNCGAGGVIQFLKSNCTYVPHDGNIPSTNYLTLGNYNIKNLLEDHDELQN